MTELITTLKQAALRRGVDKSSAGELYDLLSAACEHCCEQHSGGNGTCPPPKWEEVIAE